MNACAMVDRCLRAQHPDWYGPAPAWNIWSAAAEPIEIRQEPVPPGMTDARPEADVGIVPGYRPLEA